MRQFFSWRVWAAFAALAGLVVLLKVVLPADASSEQDASGSEERIVDFISLVYTAQPTPTFGVRDGVVSGSMDLVLDGERTMHIVEGTLGELDCPDSDQIGRCVVLADLLGEAVVWFTLLPVHTGLKVHLPPIVELVEGGYPRLENGWLVRTANTVDRQCPQETDSLTEFIERFGPKSTTIVDVATQRITIVQCSSDVKPLADD